MVYPTGTATMLIAGRYEVERPVGEGASAVVYRARDTRTGAAVAIKVLRPELTQSAASARFVKEIRRTAELRHPHILPVLESAEHEGRPCFVIPFMEGGSLRDRLKRERQLPIADALAILEPVADALDYAHAQGLIHRDVKPENILFGDGRPMLADFGIARAVEKVLDETSTSTGIVRGTPAYMSPEQASGSTDYDGRSDIYSLACVLYEMLAGMPAFVGPTPESVIAQRLTYAPRDIRVYRPTVPPAVSRAIARALEITPADRFQTAGDFLRTVRAALAEEPRAAPARSRHRWWPYVAAAGVVAALAFAAALSARRQPAAPDLPPPDTTRLVVLPFDNDTGSLNAADFVFEGLHRYRGLSLVESFATADAVRRRGRITSLDDAFAITASVNAGRFIRGRILSSGPTRIAYAALYDVPTRSELYHARVTLPDDPARLPEAFAALADSLALRGRAQLLGGEVVGRGRVNLPALEILMQGRAALAEWDLVAAESLLARAVDADPEDSRTHLWLAQVRAWLDRSSSRFAPSVERAAADSARLSLSERRQATALLALARGDYPGACSVYAEIATRQPSDFIGWYGLGHCHNRDRVVVRDSRSPSGWSYRSSYYRGILAYARAFAAFPSSLRQFEGVAYEPLMDFLFTSNTRLRRGTAADTSLTFFARPSLQGDTIAFIPYPSDRILGGHLDLAGVHEGRLHLRRMFRDITASWARALPGSAEAKEAVAIALEMLGDVAAARDSFRVARALATDPGTKVRLASSEVLADLKHAIRESGDIERSMALVDSLMRHAVPRDAASADRLARLAVLTGRCADAQRLLAAAARPLEVPVPLSATVNATVHATIPGIVMGCRAPSALRDLTQSIGFTGGSAEQRLETEYHAVGQLIGLFPREYAEEARRFAASMGDYALVVVDSLSRDNAEGARRTLARQAQRRRAAGVPGLLPDAGLTEARLWLQVGDSTMAASILDASLREFSGAQPLESRRVLENAVMLATVVPALSLRAALARARGESDARWTSIATQLWRRADPALRRSAGP